jgi:hypothetical protein
MTDKETANFQSSMSVRRLFWARDVAISVAALLAILVVSIYPLVPVFRKIFAVVLPPQLLMPRSTEVAILQLVMPWVIVLLTLFMLKSRAVPRFLPLAALLTSLGCSGALGVSLGSFWGDGDVNIDFVGFMVFIGMIYNAPGFLVCTLFAFWKTRVRHKPGECVNCGYNLTGNMSGICPECGMKLNPSGQPRPQN